MVSDDDLLERWRHAGSSPSADDSVHETAEDPDPEALEEADGGAVSSPRAQRWSGRGRRPTRTATIITVVIVLLVAGLVYTGLRLRHDDQVASARSSALAAATTDAKLLGTFHYQTVAADLAAVEGRSTPAFAKQYQTARSALTKVLAQYKANSVGSVVAVGLASASTNKAVALVFVNQAVTNSTTGTAPKNEPSRIKLTLVRTGGKWLLSDVQII